MSALAKIHVAKKQLGLDDADYRAVLQRATGKASAGAMTEPERLQALAAFEKLGFKPKSRPAGRAPHVKHIYALWGDLQKRGAVARGPKGAPALRAFVKRQTGAAAPEFLTPVAAASVTEALKSWVERIKETRT